MSERKKVIAIDGPSGAGKSTVARKTAIALGYIYLDTGAMYRTVALKAVQRGISPTDEKALAAMADALEIRFEGDPSQPRIFCDGQEVTDLIRTPEISSLASEISAFPAVRQVLVEQQRKIGALGGIVTEGRDQTTVVFPNAEVKIFLTASAEERARRRALELTQKGMCVSYEEILQQQKERDERDSQRAASPLRIADDAIVIDTDTMSIEQVVEKVLEIARS